MDGPQARQDHILVEAASSRTEYAYLQTEVCLKEDRVEPRPANIRLNLLEHIEPRINKISEADDEK
jgi:hypothetical protein